MAAGQNDGTNRIGDRGVVGDRFDPRDKGYRAPLSTIFIQRSSVDGTPNNVYRKVEPVADPFAWELFGEKGADGDPGPQGPQGIPGPAGSIDRLHYSWSDNNKPFVEATGGNYVEIAEFIFPGTNALGALTKINLLWGSDSNAKSASIRVYDRTNGNVIVEKLNFISNDRVIDDLGAFANVPAGAAVFEVQGKSDGGARAQASTIELIF